MKRLAVFGFFSFASVLLVVLYTNATAPNLNVFLERYPILADTEATYINKAMIAVDSHPLLQQGNITWERYIDTVENHVTNPKTGAPVIPLTKTEVIYVKNVINASPDVQAALAENIGAWGDVLAAAGISTGVTKDSTGHVLLHLFGEGPAPTNIPGLTNVKVGVGSTDLSRVITLNEQNYASMKSPGQPSVQVIEPQHNLVSGLVSYFSPTHAYLSYATIVFSLLDPNNLGDSPGRVIFDHENGHAIVSATIDIRPERAIDYFPLRTTGNYSDYHGGDEMTMQLKSADIALELFKKYTADPNFNANSPFGQKFLSFLQDQMIVATQNTVLLATEATLFHATGYEILTGQGPGTATLDPSAFSSNKVVGIEIRNGNNVHIMTVPVDAASMNPLGDAVAVIEKATAISIVNIRNAIDMSAEVGLPTVSYQNSVNNMLQPFQNTLINISQGSNYAASISNANIIAQSQAGAASKVVFHKWLDTPDSIDLATLDPMRVPLAQQPNAVAAVQQAYGHPMANGIWDNVTPFVSEVKTHFDTVKAEIVSGGTYAGSTLRTGGQITVNKTLNGLGLFVGATMFLTDSLAEAAYLPPSQQRTAVGEAGVNFVRSVAHGYATDLKESAVAGVSGLGLLLVTGSSFTPVGAVVAAGSLAGAYFSGKNIGGLVTSISNFMTGYNPDRAALTLQTLEGAARGERSGLEEFLRWAINTIEGKQVFRTGPIVSVGSDPTYVPIVGYNGQIQLMPNAPTQLHFSQGATMYFAGPATFIEGLNPPTENEIFSSKFFIGSESSSNVYSNLNFLLGKDGTRIYTVPEGKIIFEPKGFVTYMNTAGVRIFSLDNSTTRWDHLPDGSTLKFFSYAGRAIVEEYSSTGFRVLRAGDVVYRFNDGNGTMIDPNGVTLQPVSQTSSSDGHVFTYADGSSYTTGTKDFKSFYTQPNALVVTDTRTHDLGFGPIVGATVTDGFGQAIGSIISIDDLNQLQLLYDQAQQNYETVKGLVDSGQGGGPAMSAAVAKASSYLEQANVLSGKVQNSQEGVGVTKIRLLAEATLNLASRYVSANQPSAVESEFKVFTPSEITAWTPADAEDLAMGQAINIDLQNQNMDAAVQLNLKLDAADSIIPNVLPPHDFVTEKIDQTGGLIDFTLNLPSQFSDSSAASIGAGSTTAPSLTPAQLDRIRLSVLKSGQSYKTVHEAGKNYMVVTMPFEKGGFTVRIPL